MTMPDKLTAWEFMPSEQNEWLRGGWHYSEERSYEMKYRNYVAADISDELALALSACKPFADGYGFINGVNIIDILTAYRNAIDTASPSV